MKHKITGRSFNIAVPDIKERNMAAITGRRYAGNAYASFNALMIVGMVVFFIISLKPVKLESILFIPAGFLLIFFWIWNPDELFYH